MNAQLIEIDYKKSTPIGEVIYLIGKNSESLNIKVHLWNNRCDLISLTVKNNDLTDIENNPLIGSLPCNRVLIYTKRPKADLSIISIENNKYKVSLPDNLDRKVFSKEVPCDSGTIIMMSDFSNKFVSNKNTPFINNLIAELYLLFEEELNENKINIQVNNYVLNKQGYILFN